ncbi:alpha/beta fold hydrolase [Actinophytocola sp. NPDC049390]|uniref:alpha/beta fold hydrolase n=1 Tax=Actinophytocola sp. NPDC049390 TaxID=3363894 RepID=UPI0037878FF7
MPTIDVNGTTLCYDDTGGPGPAVVLSHSLFFDRTMFAPQVAEFGRRCRVVTYDHRGQGASARSRFVDMDTLAGDAAALITALDLGPVHFVGNSMGGFVALRLAARQPELLRSAVVLSSSADEEGEAENFLALLEYARTAGIPETVDAVAYIMFGDTTLADRVALLARWRRHFAALDESILLAAEAVVRREAVLGELVGCTVPLLVLSGAEDHAYAPELSQRIADTAANAQHVTVRGAGHSLAVEQPLVVNDLVAAHFAAT